MMKTFEEYQRTHAYVERLQQTLLDLGRTHTESQYTSMSKGFIKELSKAQREIMIYLATPLSADQQKDAA